MAMQRVTPDYSFKGQDTRQMATPTPGAAQVRPDYVQSVGDSSWRSNLLGNLMQTATALGSKFIDQQLTEEYLKGTAEAAAGKSEQDLEGNPFTKDWRTAGFRDTMGRVAMAQADAELKAAMPKLAEQGPQAMAEFLNMQRSTLMPQLNGMSGEVRAKMIPGMALRDQAAISEHKAAHQQFQWNLKGKVLTSGITQQLQDLNAVREARGLGEAYSKQEERVHAAVIDLRTSELPVAQKDQLTQEILEFSLTNKHLGLYERMRDAKTPNKVDMDGNWTSTDGLSDLQRLPVPMQEKLAEKYTKAREATQAIANQDFVDRGTIFQNEFKNGTSNLTFEQMMAYANAHTQMFPTKQEWRSKFIDDWHDMMFKRNGNIGNAQAYFSNNPDYLASQGKTMGDVRSDVIKALQAKPMSERLDTLSNSIALGNRDASKMFGEFVAPSIAAYSAPDGKVPMEHKQAVEALFKQMDKHPNDSMQVSYIMAGIPEELQLRVQTLRELHRVGVTGDPAVARMLEVEKSMSNMTIQEKAVLAHGTSKDDEQYLNKIGNDGWLGHAWDTVAGPFSRTHELRGNMELWGVMKKATPESRAQYRDSAIRTYKDALRDEMRALALTGMTGNSENRAEIAMGNVLNRTVQVGSLPVVLPRGETPHKYFGLADVATPVPIIDAALSNRIAPITEKGTMEVIIDHRGVVYQEYDRNGIRVPTNAGILKPSVIGEDVARIQSTRKKPIVEEVGEGVTYKDKNVEFKYNGVNTVGVPTKDMLAFRKDMIEFEGVVSVAKPDLSGKLKKDGTPVLTVGVGVSQTNPTHFPKLGADNTITPDDLASSFKGASNEAAHKAVQLQRAIGIENSASFRLLAGFAYQGQGDTTSRKAFYTALKSRNEEEALKALKETTAYKMSQTRRKQYYENLTIAALKG